MFIFDTHPHLIEEDFDDDLDEVILRARSADVNHILNVSYDGESSVKGVDLANKEDGIYTSIGIHPHWAEELNDEVLEDLFLLAKKEKVLAIGEIGLDYYKSTSSREIQQKAFLAQIELANSLDLPVLIHDRDAHGDLFELIKNNRPKRGGILHCFSGSLELAQEGIKLGFYISFAGPLTFKNSRRLPEIAVKIPLEKIVIETDSPYLAPEPLRGRRNEPAYVVYVLEKLAELRQKNNTEMAEITFRNAKDILGLS
jgi:TatD DNase family protein